MRESPLLKRLDKAGSVLETIMLIFLLMAMMLIAVGQIVMRVFFDAGFGWADELIRLIVLWLAMVGSIAACRDNRHIRIDALSHIMSDTTVTAIRILVDLFAAFVCGVIAVQAWSYLQIEIEYEVTVLVDTPAWIAHLIMPAAFVLLAYRFFVVALGQAATLLFGKTDGAEE